MTGRPRALDGVRVVDAATLAAAPLLATTLAEHGADVIKVEQPGAGDPFRKWGELKAGIGLMWKSASRNKRCVTIDLRQAAGQELLHGLLAQSDVLVLNHRPSALARWGIAPAALTARHPHLIVVHVTGYGAGGPKSDRPGFGTLAEAMSGFSHLTGQPDGPPTLPLFPLADGVASMAGTTAVLLALYHRDVHGGGGQHIDVNLIEPLARLMENNTLAWDQLGRLARRTGNRWDASAPRNAYRTADDRWVVLSSATDSTIRRVYQAIGRPELADDPGYVDQVARLDHADEIDKLVETWVAERPLATVVEVFERLEVAAAPVYDAEQLMADPHLTARGTWLAVDDPDLGPMRVQAPVARLSATPGRVDHLGPPLGAHNDEVFGGLLGLGAERLAELRAAGVI